MSLHLAQSPYRSSIVESPTLGNSTIRNSTSENFAVGNSTLGNLTMWNSAAEKFTIGNSTIGDPMIIAAAKQAFEDHYVGLVRGIRQRAYPAYFNPTSGLEADDGDKRSSTKFSQIETVIPIFLLHPLYSTIFEQSMRNILHRLSTGEESGYRGIAEGKIYEISTNGWVSRAQGDLEYLKYTLLGLNSTVHQSQQQGWRLTESGHERIMAYLRPRLCSFLSANPRVDCGGIGEPQSVSIQTRGAVGAVSPGLLQSRKQEKRRRELRLQEGFTWP